MTTRRLVNSMRLSWLGAARMNTRPAPLSGKSRLAVLLEHFATIDDPRDVRRIAHPLAEILLLVVCATVADCDDYDHIAAWGTAHLEFLRRHLPYRHGMPGGRWPTILMNRINPALFSTGFTSWVRATWPERPDFVAIDGKTSRGSHDRAAGVAPIHLVSAFATTAHLVLGQEAVPDKAGELAAIPVLLARLAERDRLRGALVSIDAIATNGTIAKAIRDAGANYLLAVKANQPSLRAEVEACFTAAPSRSLDTHTEHDKGHGRTEQRTTSVVREVDWLSGERRFPASCACPTSPASSASRPVSDAATRHIPKPAITHPRPRSPPRRRAKRSAATGASRTGCTGCSLSSSTTTNPAYERVSAPRTWPWSATSLSTSSEPPRIRNPSSSAAKSQAGRPTTSTRSSTTGSGELGFMALAAGWDDDFFASLIAQ